MSIRILHCGKSIENYNICLENEVAGFTRRGPEIGDVIYIVVRSKKSILCGIRGILSDVTDFKPWPDSDNYVISFNLENVEYAKPFDIKFLSTVGGTYWNLKYLQGAKVIKDEQAIHLLDDSFSLHKDEKPHFLDKPKINDNNNDNKLEQNEIQETQESIDKIIEEVPEEKISVMGTFQTIKFKNETDELRGLEPLVNQNFYLLFPFYTSQKSLLIPENRLFISAGLDARGDQPIRGIKSIPDALLIVYNRKFKCPIQVNLIEYECFGEGKVRAQEKSNYLNGQVIPQLMKFASSFSIVTDKQIREQTIKLWVDKIIKYIFEDKNRQDMFTSWIKEIEPELSDQLVGREIDKILTDAFKTSLKIILVIDDLSSEQKNTISNVIKAFKLENGDSINFLAYIVRLEQKISLTDIAAEYALSVQ